MSKTVPFKKETNPEQSREVVRRNELTGIMKQVIDNINEMAKHLMTDVNVLFKRFVYPLMMRTNAIENVLISKGIITKEEINEEAKRITEEAIAKAKEVDENGQSKEGVKAKESAKIERIEGSLEVGEETLNIQESTQE